MYDKQLTRTPLELGALGGTLQERTEVMLGRCAVWSRLLGRAPDAPFVLRMIATGGGRTRLDTGEVFIPQDDPENPLVLEHELSHHAFGSDMAVQSRAVGTALTGYMAASRTPLSQSESATLSEFLHGMFNMLDDLRVCSLWETLYPYSGALLRRRWKEIAGTFPAERINADLLTAVVVVAAGARLSSRVSPVVQAIAPTIEAAARRCVRTDIHGLAAVFLDLAQALRHLMGQEPPPPPSQGGGAQSPQGQPKGGLGQNGSGQPPPPPGKSNALPQRAPASPNKAPADDLGTRQVKNILAKQRPDPLPGGSLGSPSMDRQMSDVPKQGAGEELLRARAAGHQVPLSGTEEEVPTFQPSVDDVVEAGVDAMQALLAKYIDQMTILASSQDPTGGEVGQAWVTVAATTAGITAHQVHPEKGLPAPSVQAARLRRTLESVRRSRRRRRTWDGDMLDIDVVVSSISEDNWDSPVCTEELKSGGLDLLVLVDVSGSMSGERSIKQLNQSIADLLYACKAAPYLRLHQWCFSDDLFMFHKPGGFVGQVEWGCTNMIAALEMAGAWARRLSRQRAVLLITDGEPTSCRAKGSTGNCIQDLVKVTEELRAQRVLLEAVLMGRPSESLQRVFRAKGLPSKAEVGPELVKAAGRILAGAV